MIIETHYVRHGKGPQRIIGKTTNQGVIKIWTEIYHSTNAYEMKSMKSEIKRKSVSMTQKEKENNKFKAIIKIGK